MPLFGEDLLFARLGRKLVEFGEGMAQIIGFAPCGRNPFGQSIARVARVAPSRMGRRKFF